MNRLIIPGLLCGICTGACSGPANMAPTPEQPRTVRFVTIENRALESGIAASGRLIPQEEAAVAPQIAGYQIARVLADQGDRVVAGQVLAILDDTLLRADIAQQQAAVAQARVAAEQADQQAARVADLDNSGVLSAEAIAQRRLAARTARAQLAQTLALLNAQQVRMKLMVVRAPVAGRILSRTARPGDVSSIGTALFRIARDGRIELDAELAEQDLARVRTGDRARVTLADGAIVPGTVRFVGAEIDTDSRLGRVRLTLPVRDDIRAGGFADAAFLPRSGVVHAVRETAVSYTASGATVATINRSNVVATVPVNVGNRGGGYVALVRGPVAGTRVLLGAQDFVLDGDTVRPVPASAAQAH